MYSIIMFISITPFAIKIARWWTIQFFN